MADMNNVGAVAKALMKFVDAMNNYGLCYHNLEQISDICPDIKEHVDVINSWRKNEIMIQTVPYVVKESEVEVKPPTSTQTQTHTSTTNTTKPSQKVTRNRLGGAKVVEIAQLIADKYDGKKVDSVVSALAKNKKYKYDERTFRNLVGKVTYVDLTNPYFTIVDGKIHKTIIRNKSVFGNDADSAKRISELLDKNNGDIMSTITDEMSADDIIRIALVRWKGFRTGKYDDIGSPTKEILMMGVIREDKSLNANKIVEIMHVKYDIPCDVAEASVIKNGRSYKGLAKILGVIE
jgi:hypothetical protein